MADNSKETYMHASVRNFFKIVMVALLCQLIVACSTPETVVTQISNTLGPKCKARFTDERVGMYSYAVQTFGGGGVFALAKEDGREACGYGSAFDRVANSQHEGVALRKCESERLALGISNPCRVYARNFNVVWNETSYVTESQFIKNRELERQSKRVEELKAATQKNENQQLMQKQDAKLVPQNIITQQTQSTNSLGEKNGRLTLDDSKKKCTELGFKPATEGHGKCVLQLSK